MRTGLFYDFIIVQQRLQINAATLCELSKKSMVSLFPLSRAIGECAPNNSSLKKEHFGIRIIFIAIAMADINEGNIIIGQTFYFLFNRIEKVLIFIHFFSPSYCVVFEEKLYPLLIAVIIA